MSKKPCGGRACAKWLAENGVSETSDAICYQCGFEGPMCAWYDESASREADESDNDGE